MGFDIIGDVHGHYHKLRALLQHMGYHHRDGVWQCAGRTAVFVGDLIDRGPGQLETVDLVRRMVDAGNARCVMGNHELNAIAWTIPDPNRPGEYLRRHGKSGNRSQHQAFLDAVESTPHHDASIDWFKTLPLWIDLGGVRVVHACWHEASIEKLRPFLGAGDRLSDELIVMSCRKGHWAHTAVENLCKGPEVALPRGWAYVDRGGKRRTDVRLRWWQPDLSTYRRAAIGPPDDMALLPDEPMPADVSTYRYAGPPVVFGHYWFTGTPRVISDRFACVDYSAAADGALVAYRWDGERELSSDKLAWLPATP